MSAERDLTRVVRSWLREDEHDAADRVLEVVLSRLDTTPQRRSWWPARRYARVNRLVPTAIAAAAVLVIAVLGYNLLPAVGVGGPPSPTPTPAPLPSGSMAAGTYLFSDVRFTSAPFSVTVPAGWSNADGFIEKGNPFDANGVLFTTWLITHVYADSCEWQGTLRATPTKAQLVEALGAQTGHQTAGPTELTLGGRPATKLVFSVPVDFDMAACQSPYLRLWPDPGPDEAGGFPISPGWTTTALIVERDGIPTAVVAMQHADSPAADVAELQAVLDSVQFLP